MLKNYIKLLSALTCISLSVIQAQKPQIKVGNYNTGIPDSQFVNRPFTISNYGAPGQTFSAQKMGGGVIELVSEFPNFDITKLTPNSTLTIQGFPPTPPLTPWGWYALNKNQGRFEWKVSRLPNAPSAAPAPTPAPIPSTPVATPTPTPAPVPSTPIATPAPKPTPQQPPTAAPTPAPQPTATATITIKPNISPRGREMVLKELQDSLWINIDKYPTTEKTWKIKIDPDLTIDAAGNFILKIDPSKLSINPKSKLTVTSNLGIFNTPDAEPNGLYELVDTDAKGNTGALWLNKINPAAPAMTQATTATLPGKPAPPLVKAPAVPTTPTPAAQPAPPLTTPVAQPTIPTPATLQSCDCRKIGNVWTSRVFIVPKQADINACKSVCKAHGGTTIRFGTSPTSYSI